MAVMAGRNARQKTSSPASINVRIECVLPLPGGPIRRTLVPGIVILNLLGLRQRSLVYGLDFGFDCVKVNVEVNAVILGEYVTDENESDD